jgi:hypothetical protein
MMKVEVQSQQEAENSDAVVCILAPEGKPLLMSDNVFGVCSECGRRVQHRPHIPVRPILLCIECCPPSPHHRNVITPATLRELMKKSAH